MMYFFLYWLYVICTRQVYVLVSFCLLYNEDFYNGVWTVRLTVRCKLFIRISDYLLCIVNFSWWELFLLFIYFNGKSICPGCTHGYTMCTCVSLLTPTVYMLPLATCMYEG